MSNIYCKVHGCPNPNLPEQEYCDTHFLLPYVSPFCKVAYCRESRLPKQQYCQTHYLRPDSTKSPLTAGSILNTAAQHMVERAATYDQQGGERSIHKTVAMFNTLTGAGLTDEQGWLFMVCLKMVRTQQGRYRADSYEDGAAYFALAGESAAQERV